MHANRITVTVLVAALLGVGWSGTESAPAQETKPAERAKLTADSRDPASELTLEEVEAALAAIESDSSLDDTAKSALRPNYEQAVAAFRASAEFASKATAFAEAVDSAPKQTAAIRGELQGLEPVEQAANIALPEDPAELQQLAESRRAKRTVLTDELSATNAELERIRGRPVQVSKRLSEVERELTRIREQLASGAEVDVDESPSRTAERIELQAAQIQLSNEIAMLTQEQRSQKPRAELLEAQRELLERNVENATAAVNRVDSALRERLMTTAEQIRTRLDGVLSDLPDDDPEVPRLDSEVQELVTEFEAAIRSAADAKLALDDVSRRLEILKREYTSIREQLALGGGGRVMVQVLRELDDLCRRAPQELARCPVPPLDQTRLQSIRVRDKIHRQADLERRFRQQTSASVAELIKIRRELLTDLNRQYENLAPALAALQADQYKFLSLSDEAHTYIAEQLFGYRLRSCPPISVQTFRDLPAGIGWLLQPDHWLEFGRALGRVLSRNAFRSLMVLLLVATLLCLRPRIRTNLERAGVKTRRISTDRYAFTGEALGWTVLLAIPLPTLVGYFAWGFGQDPLVSEWTRGLTGGLNESVKIFAAATFMSAVLLPGGLGGVHFGWQQERLDRIRWAILAGLVIYLPATLLTYACFRGEAGEYFDSLGRVTMLVALFWISGVTSRLFAASGGLPPSLRNEQRSRFLFCSQRLWFPVLLLYPLVLAALAMMGYLLTVVAASHRFLLTLGLIAGGEILHGLTRRWFTIKQRKLALAEAIERRRARQEAVNEEGESAATSETIAIDPEDQVELDLDEATSVSQTRASKSHFRSRICTFAAAGNGSGRRVRATATITEWTVASGQDGSRRPPNRQNRQDLPCRWPIKSVATSKFATSPTRRSLKGPYFFFFLRGAFQTVNVRESLILTTNRV